jgi:KUP system potassium uptake protein
VPLLIDHDLRSQNAFCNPQAEEYKGARSAVERPVMAEHAGTPPATREGEASKRHPSFWALTLGSVGVVYGDIGTSPLYALREAVSAGAAGGPITGPVVLGVLSLIFWSLIIVVTLKYILILLRADNNGEGGTLALTALVFRAMGHGAPIALVLGIIGASMFYGSVLITPALSVLSAVEGIKVHTPAFEPYVLPLAALILITLFSVQSRGTARVSAFFGPVTLVWFLVLATAGMVQIAGNPSVLLAINPVYGVNFLVEHRVIGLVTLAAVFLVVTGSEALYNDLGHFGRKPITAAWFYLVLPALLLNYFGQGALVLANASTLQNPFYLMFPDWALFPMVIMATMATVIASQAVITGAYSVTQQAIQLGLLPRFEIRHTSAAVAGQIYMPRVNWLLLGGVLLLVVVFRSSSALAHAYVLAVATTNLMAVTLGFLVVWKCWRWPLATAALMMVPFILVDAAFVAATSLNIVEGAWLPILFGALIMLTIITWRRGTSVLLQKTRRTEVPLNSLVATLEKRPHIVAGTAVFLTSDPDYTPTSLLHNLKHNKVLHENNVVLTVVTSDTPRVPEEDRVFITHLSDRFLLVRLQYGFMEQPNVPKALAIARRQGWTFDIMATSFFLSRRVIRASAHSGLPLWQDRLFISLARSAHDASEFFQIPTGRVVEIGTQVAV